jgi:hypothetical protein
VPQPGDAGRATAHDAEELAPPLRPRVGGASPSMGPVSAEAADQSVRTRAFDFLARLSQIHPNGIPWSVLLAGFDFGGRRVPLASQQGIFKPAVCRLPLSMRTAPIVEGRARPYEDEQDSEGLILYKYRGAHSAPRGSAPRGRYRGCPEERDAGTSLRRPRRSPAPGARRLTRPAAGSKTPPSNCSLDAPPRAARG